MKEIWKPVVGFDGFYEVSNLGRIRICRVMKPGKRQDGYAGVVFYAPGRRRQMLVHAVVLEAFKGPRPPGQVARHIDGVRANNYATNLEWGTYQEHSTDRERHGTVNHGERHGFSKLKNADVIKMRELRAGGKPVIGIAKQFSVTPSNVYHIVKRHTWGHV